jgi:ATP-dependent DNA helicase RecG
LLSLLRDADLIRDARADATALIETDPELAGHPALAAMLAQFVDEERAEYLEKG